jgi:hypothetical protein
MRWRGRVAGLVVLGLAVVPGKSCGPFFTEAVFVSRQPESRGALMDGKLGIVWPDFGTVDLALVYRELQGPAFTLEERKQVSASAERNSQERDGRASVALSHWLEARKEFTEEGGDTPATDAAAPGQQWQTYPNCLDDAFETAARTLRARMRDLAAAKADVAEWVQGQDAVFSNCGGPGRIPRELQVGTANWLRQDREYQIAAAHFYRAEWDPAKAGFSTLAREVGSPWHEVAEYMVARSLIRQAMLSEPDGVDEELMQEAQTQLKAVVGRNGRYAGPAQELLNFVDLRIDPGAAAVRLGGLIGKPDARLQQHLIDLRYALSQPSFIADIAEGRRNELVDWVLTTKLEPGRQDAAAHALERWRSTKSIAWMVSAMMLAQSPQPDLMAAAAAIPESSSAWATVTYRRLRVTQDNAVVRVEIAKLLPEMGRREPISTVNAFREMAQKKTVSLDGFIELAAMEPAGYDDGTGEGIASGNEAAPGVTRATMAGLAVNAAGAKRFNIETATILNERLPLLTLAGIVHRQELPKQLQFEVAMAVWTRAVLLDKPEVARTLTPAMVEGEPGWRQWLVAYDNAKTKEDREVAGLLALMRFPSVRPYVNAGAGREEGFVGYSVLRDNWWCGGMGEEKNWTDSYSTGYNFRGGRETNSSPQRLPNELPPFVTPAMASEAQREQAAIHKIGDAPEYFGMRTLAWVKAHPSDPRGAELLGFAFRAMRNGCNLESSSRLRREVFNVLHTRYRH